jgi:hypothetical protein
MSLGRVDKPARLAKAGAVADIPMPVIAGDDQRQTPCDAAETLMRALAPFEATGAQRRPLG